MRLELSQALGLPRKKKPSKDIVKKQLKRARQMFINERVAKDKERLATALGLQAQYKDKHRQVRRTPENQKLLAVWEAEAKAAQLYLELTTAWAGEYFDRIMAMVADPECDYSDEEP